jgi:hypothetical protein
MKFKPLHNGPEGIRNSNQNSINKFSEHNDYEFTLKDDPVVPIKPCSRCKHDKGFITYTYKRYDDDMRFSHFGMIRCDRCGVPQTWIPKKGRELLCKKHNINLS